MPNPQPSAPPGTSGSRYKRSLGTWLLLAFVLLALLPAITSLPGWWASRTIQEPLLRVANVVETFGHHDRGFRQGVRDLYARLFVTRNFEDRDIYAVTAAEIRQNLATMRRHVTMLADSDLSSANTDYVALQSDIELHTETYLALVDRRLEQKEHNLALADSVRGIGRGMSETVATASPPVRTATAAGFAALAAELAVLVDSVLLVQEGESADEIAALKDSARAILRRYETMIAQVAGAPDRETLAVRLDQLETMITGDAGLISGAEALTSLNQREFNDRIALRTDVIALIARLVEADEANDKAASSLLTDASTALARYYRSTLVTVILGTLLALAVVIIFVRGNVLRRLGRITDTTRRLTSGQLDEPVAEAGSDELGELAAALETFRQSALELRESKAELSVRSAELESVNRELDQFAYVASHDLKAPMRAIASLSTFLQEDLEDALTDGSKRHFNMLDERIRRLEKLLDSLLEYSRAGQVHAERETVDLRETIEHSIELVAPAGSEVIYKGGFGQVLTYRSPLEQIVRNLADNAFKHNDKEHGSVVITCDVADDVVHLSVADNGPGIPPKFHERVFGMFQTLQPRDKVEGSGMGLAILKKLIESHGGTIELDSDPDVRRGTTFVVRWPVAAAPVTLGKT
jgi:signal transduction histidine kinase